MRLFSSKKVIASMLLGASLLIVPGCSLDVEMSTTGRLQILVEDTAGNPVPNMKADLLLDDRTTIARSTTTGTDGKAEFDAGGGVAIQVYYIRLNLTPDWKMAPDDTNDKAVIPSPGSLVLVSFRLAKVVTP
jgi:hypothetical protein